MASNLIIVEGTTMTYSCYLLCHWSLVKSFNDNSIGQKWSKTITYHDPLFAGLSRGAIKTHVFIVLFTFHILLYLFFTYFFLSGTCHYAKCYTDCIINYEYLFDGVFLLLSFYMRAWTFNSVVVYVYTVYTDESKL